jgi:hypothetical protein
MTLSSSAKRQIYFDASLLLTAVGLIVAWAFDLAYIFVPLACLLGAAMVFWNHPRLRRVRGD